MHLPADITHICIVGGGNASQVLAALLSHTPDHPHISLLATYADEAHRLQTAITENQGLTLENPDGTTTTATPDLITRDPAAAVPNAQLVIFPLPLFAIPPSVKLVAPHLQSDAWVLFMPAQGGVQWIAAHYAKDLPHKVTIVGLDKLPYNCRALEYGKRIKVFAYKTNLGFATIPSGDAQQHGVLVTRIAGTLSAVIPRLTVHPLDSFLVPTLSPANQCIHPARMYGMFHRETTRSRVPLFYEEMDDFSASMINKVSEEIQLIARGLEAAGSRAGYSVRMSEVPTVADATLAVYKSKDTSTLARLFATCDGFQGISTPMRKRAEGDYEVDWENRYFTEDINSLTVLHGIAQLLHVETPTIDNLIRWAQDNVKTVGKLLDEDGNLITGGDGIRYPPQEWGFKTLDDFLAFHCTKVDTSNGASQDPPVYSD